MRTSILLLAFSSLLPLASHAQAPVLQSTLPAAHSLTGSRTGTVQFTFSQPVPSTAAIQVNTNFYSGRRPGTFTGAGTNQLSFQPSRPFAPGERVSITVPASVSQRARVVEFRAAAGAGSMQFGAPVTIGPPPTSRPAAVVAGDLDNDGDLDLVAGDALGATICLNNGSGQFTPAALPVAIAPRANDLQLADVNGDGILDLLSSGVITPSAYLNLGTGQGSFQARVELMTPSFMSQLITGDFNADGLSDVVVGEPVGTGLAVHFFPGNPSGNLVETRTSAAISGRDLAAADFDEDGDLDLLMVTGDMLGAALNDGTGQFSMGATLPVSVQMAELTLGDFTGDGHVDAVCTTYPSNTLYLVPGTGTGGWQAARPISVLSGTWHVRSADMNGDAKLDLLVPNDRGGLQILLNNGSGQFTAPGTVLTGGQAFTHADAADLNGDGTLDVYTGHQTLGSGPQGIDVFFHQLGPTTATRNSNTLSFSAFPNPAHEQLTLQLPPLPVPVSVELRDALGRLVRHLPAPLPTSSGPYVVSLAGLAPGRYAVLARSARSQGMQWIDVK